MKLQSAIAIYILFWVMSAFVILPFGVKTHDEAGIPRVPGQAESAPANFRPRLILLRTTILATIVFALFYGNFVYGWVNTNQLELVKPPA